MKSFTISVITLIIISFFFLINAQAAEAARVRGYSNRNGTYVQPHYRSNPNSYKWDNYSSRGNMNPYTGKRGYKNW